MGSGYEGHIHAVCHRHKHGCDMVCSPQALPCTNRDNNRLAFNVFRVNTVILIIAQRLGKVYRRHAGSPVKQII